MEDKRLQDKAVDREAGKPGWIQSREMEREIQELEQVIEEGNELLGLPPLPPWDG